jgi:hypothetical protein
MSQDMRMYETFYGIHVNDWGITFGGAFDESHYILTKDYINEGCACEETSEVSNTLKFIYPHHTAKTYFIEGVISGHFTLASSSAAAKITKYRVSIFKIHESTGDENELFSTGWIIVDDELSWNSDYEIGEEKVYPFWIDAWEKEKLTEFERFYLKIEVEGDSYTYFWHSNDSTWEDIKVEIPFIM